MLIFMEFFSSINIYIFQSIHMYLFLSTETGKGEEKHVSDSNTIREAGTVPRIERFDQLC